MSNLEIHKPRGKMPRITIRCGVVEHKWETFGLCKIGEKLAILEKCAECGVLREASNLPR